MFFDDKQTIINTKHITEKNINGYISCLSCLCKTCCNTNKTLDIFPKIAPKSYSDILADYILNERFDLIANDILKINKTKMNIINDKINYLKFNLNEKTAILNNLVNENQKLSNNLDLEVEKFKILNEQYCKNKELCDNIKNQLLQFSIDLFKQNKKQIDDQINKCNELNNTSKYSIPECKICMMKEVKIAIQCGHIFCMDCYNELVKAYKLKSNPVSEDSNDDNSNQIDILIKCPTCRTDCFSYTQLYF
jgi:hypothetical protein